MKEIDAVDRMIQIMMETLDSIACQIVEMYEELDTLADLERFRTVELDPSGGGPAPPPRWVGSQGVKAEGAD